MSDWGKETRDFVRGYTLAMIWANTFDLRTYESLDFESGDATAQCKRYARLLDPGARKVMREDCVDFLCDATREEIRHEVRVHDYTFEQAGHDFALTRNRHGAGFWDRGLTYGDLLTQRSHTFGEQTLWFDGTTIKE